MRAHLVDQHAGILAGILRELPRRLFQRVLENLQTGAFVALARRLGLSAMIAIGWPPRAICSSSGIRSFITLTLRSVNRMKACSSTASIFSGSVTK
jgi:hypothetical protein